MTTQDGVLERCIERANRNLGLVAGGLIFLATVSLLVNYRFIAYCITGALPADRAAILRSTASDYPSDYMRIEGGETTEIGEETETKGRFGSPRVVARFHVVGIGGNLLIVKSSANRKSPPFEGQLAQIPKELWIKVLGPAMKEDPDLKQRILPVMLDATGTHQSGLFWLALAVLTGAFGLVLLAKFVHRASVPGRHPSYRELERFGVASDVAEAIRAESSCQELESGSVCYTENWVVLPGVFMVHVFKYTDLIWLRVQSGAKLLNVIPAVWSNGAVVCDRYGVAATTASWMNRNKSASIVAELSRRAPWALVGDAPEFAFGWLNDRAGMIAHVDTQRTKLESAPETETAEP